MRSRKLLDGDFSGCTHRSSADRVGRAYHCGELEVNLLCLSVHPIGSYRQADTVKWQEVHVTCLADRESLHNRCQGDIMQIGHI